MNNGKKNDNISTPSKTGNESLSGGSMNEPGGKKQDMSSTAGGQSGSAGFNTGGGTGSVGGTGASSTGSTGGAGGGTSMGSTGGTSMSTTGTGGSGGTGAATATARSLVDKAKETASTAYETVSEKAVTKIDEKKSTLTDGLSNAADTIRQAGESMTTTGGGTAFAEKASQYTNTAAGKIEDAARYFENHDARAMMRDVEGFARRNPAVFLGVAFATGVLLSRFLKAGSTSTSSTGNNRAGNRNSFDSGFEGQGTGFGSTPGIN